MGQWTPERLQQQSPEPDRVGPPPETAGEVAVEQIMRLLAKPELGAGYLIVWSDKGEKLFELDVPPPERSGKYEIVYGHGSTFTPSEDCTPAALELHTEGMAFVRHFPHWRRLTGDPLPDTLRFQYGFCLNLDRSSKTKVERVYSRTISYDD